MDTVVQWNTSSTMEGLSSVVAVTGKTCCVVTGVVIMYFYSLVKTWNVEEGKIIHTLNGHTDEIEVTYIVTTFILLLLEPSYYCN